MRTEQHKLALFSLAPGPHKRYFQLLVVDFSVLSERSKILLVLGLPQRGTGAVKHVLESCGVPCRNVETLAKAQQDFLTEVGNGWDSPLELPERCLQNDAAKQFSSLLIKTLETQSADQCGLACVHGM